MEVIQFLEDFGNPGDPVEFQYTHVLYLLRRPNWPRILANPIHLQDRYQGQRLVQHELDPHRSLLSDIRGFIYASQNRPVEKKKKMVMPADTSRSPTYQITVTITQMESKTKCWRKREFVSTWTSILIQTLPGITAARLNINRPLFYKVWPDIDGQSESEKIQQEDLLLKRGGGGQSSNWSRG